MEAEKHPHQSERLAALRSYGILDTEREADFDDVVALASRICGTAISVVNLIDAERQWFKAEVGLGARETPLATSICSHIILQDDFVEIEDTLADPRMADNPLCLAEEGPLRFYAGALLKNADGLPLGTLCVLDNKPRKLTDLQREAIRVLARQVMAQLEMRKALRQAESLRKEIDHRVKNSLTSLATFVRLKSRVAASDEVREALDALENRISAMSLLHAQLYRAETGQALAFARYLTALHAHLAAVAPENITIDLDIAPEAETVLVDARRAASAGLLVNEFVTNSTKYAFPDDRDGRVQIRMALQDDGLIEIACNDDGVGISEASEPAAGGLGLQIAEAVCEQLGTQLEFTATDSGVSARFVFAPGTLPEL